MVREFEDILMATHYMNLYYYCTSTEGLGDIACKIGVTLLRYSGIIPADKVCVYVCIYVCMYVLYLRFSVYAGTVCNYVWKYPLLLGCGDNATDKALRTYTYKQT